MRVCLAAFFGLLSLIRPGHTQPGLCTHTLALLVTETVYSSPLAELPRVEVRQCASPSETLQIVAWRAKQSSPDLVIDTTDFTVVQLAARGNVYVIETTGGPRSRIYVISYIDDRPKLALLRVTKGTTRITIDPELIEVVIGGIYSGDAPPRSEIHRFEVK